MKVHGATAAERAARAAARFVARPEVFDVEMLWATEVALHLAATLRRLALAWPATVSGAVAEGEGEGARQPFQEPLASRGAVLALSEVGVAGGPGARIDAVLAEAEAHLEERFCAALPVSVRRALDHVVRTVEGASPRNDRRVAARFSRASRAVFAAGVARHPAGLAAEDVLLPRARRDAGVWLQRCRSLRASAEIATMGEGDRAGPDGQLRRLAGVAAARTTLEAIAAARAALVRQVRADPPRRAGTSRRAAAAPIGRS